MRFNFPATLALALTLLPSTLALGINCRGSGACTGLVRPAVPPLVHAIWSLDDNYLWSTREPIACYIRVCAFLQPWSGHGADTIDKGVTGRRIKELAREIFKHGCTECGSVPLDYPESNDGAVAGELTFNVVKNTSSRGRCPMGPETDIKEATLCVKESSADYQKNMNGPRRGKRGLRNAVEETRRRANETVADK
ncbi:Kp4-domain-containing protein [Tothia fuscella]|uniref:Kp4-domain-containing protein n=1 Tax=Tothia fuscella TaxID=1048955 RepID=A0A9P4NP46_9PEZI|nr:Kp4-domain-containing protein [Tothia fuscella]